MEVSRSNPKKFSNDNERGVVRDITAKWSDYPKTSKFPVLCWKNPE